MSTSRRVVATGYGGPENLEVQEVVLADPGRGQAQVSVRAAGVNPADAKSYRNAGDPSRLPLPLGYEAAGVVTAVGPDTSVSVGDEVIVFRVSGAYAGDLVVGQDALTPKPATLGWPEAAGLMLAGATAWHTLEATRTGSGDTVLVHGGAGGVGLNAVQLARLRGARVIATAGERNHDLLRELGAEPVRYGDGLLERVRALTPDGIDVALDLVGSDEALDVSLALVPERDRIASVANFLRAPGEGVQLLSDDAPRMAFRPELARLAGEGKLRVLVAATYALDDAAEAHRQIATGHTTGKLVLLP
jgi:NADPH:quinone reductase